MPTPQERKALLFLSLLTLLGAGVRLVRAVRAAPPPDPAAQAALRRQIAAVDSARARAGRRRVPAGAGRIVAGRGKRTSPGRSARSQDGERALAPQPVLPRRSVGGLSVAPLTTRPAPLVDLDRAPEAEIERLPYIGPALARRIVAERDSAGPFGSLEGLQRVRGVGPALARKLASSVTFSLPPRQSRVEEGGRHASPAKRRRARGPRSP